ncbi:uncharacterized protein LOC132277029 [Cornus florida]|uniref:uncharacterized protein LOC132277029 n=1 Tax=Cornus florida TaxID=4283 RepID=UPI0028A17F7E|nr:uncharacterized protein LOC132277029 [Cornus florida]
MDFVVGLLRSIHNHDTVWVIVDRLTKSAHFLPIRATDTVKELSFSTPLSLSTAFHPQNDGQFERVIQASIGMAPYEALYGRPCHSPICWAEVGDVSPMKGVTRFGRKKGKLAPRFIGPFEITERIGEVAYRLALPPRLSAVHDVFHVSMLRRCLRDETQVIDCAEVQIRPNTTYVETPVRIVNSIVKQLRRAEIPLVKVQWNHQDEREATWELESEMKGKYPHLFE